MAALMAGAAVLRAWELGNLSAWVDECSYYFLDAPDFDTYFAIMKFWAPDNVMLYYIVFYAWHLVFGASLFAMRMLTVVAGLAAIPLAWAIGKRVFNSTSGWFAAVCVAVSPFQIWHAQSIRPYGLCIPIVLLGLYALLRVREGARWWGLAWVCNVVLLWLHPFMAFLLPAQVLYVWALEPHGLRKAVAWSLAQVPVLVPPFLWMLPHMVNVAEAEVDHLSSPSLPTVLVDLVGDDAVRLSGEFPIELTERFTQTPAIAFWLHYNGLVLMALVGLLALATVPLVAHRQRGGDAGPLLLLMAAVLPVLLLAALSYAWRPCMETRYTPYAPIALYVLIGAVLSGGRWRLVRALLTGVLVGLISWETAIYLIGETHTRWRDASRIIATQEEPGDLVLVRAAMPRSFHAYLANHVAHAAPVAPVRTMTGLVEDTLGYFAQEAENGSVGGKSVWAVIELTFLKDGEVRAALGEQFTPLGIDQEYVALPGMLGILLGRFTARPDAEAFPVPPVPEEVIENCRYILAQVGLDELPEEEGRRAAATLARVIDIPVTLGKNTAFILSVFLAEEGEYALALPFAEDAVRREPAYGAGYFAAGMARAGVGETAAAQEDFERAFALDDNLRELYAPLVTALYREPDSEVVAAEAARLAPTGFPYMAMRGLALRVFPGASLPAAE